MSDMQVDPGLERLDFRAPFIAILILYVLMLVPVFLGHPGWATGAWVFMLALIGVSALWVGRDLQALRAEHDFTSRTRNYQGMAKPFRTRLAIGFSNFVTGVVVVATLPVYIVFLLMGLIFQSRVARAASGGLGLFVNGTAVSALCILVMAALVYFLRLDTYYWMGPYWMPALLNFAALMWLLHAVLRPQAVSEAWRISAWPAGVILGVIVAASIVFGALLNLDLTRRLGLSHGGLTDLEGLLARFLDLPGLAEVTDLVRQASTGEILREGAGDTLLNLQWTAFGLLLAATSFQLVWKVFNAQRGEHELLTIANMHMSLGDVAAARRVAEEDMTESMIGRHDLLAQVAAVEGDAFAYWTELAAFSERRFYDMFQSHRPYVLHWQSEGHLGAYEKQFEAMMLIRAARFMFLDDSPVLVYCTLAAQMPVAGEPDAPIRPYVANAAASLADRGIEDPLALAFFGRVSGLTGIEHARDSAPFIPDGADADDACVWVGMHLLCGMIAERMAGRTGQDSDDAALSVRDSLVSIYERIGNPAVKFFFFQILRDAVLQVDEPLRPSMSSVFDAALRTGVAEAQAKLTRYFK